MLLWAIKPAWEYWEHILLATRYFGQSLNERAGRRTHPTVVEVVEVAGHPVQVGSPVAVEVAVLVEAGAFPEVVEVLAGVEAAAVGDRMMLGFVVNDPSPSSLRQKCRKSINPVNPNQIPDYFWRSI